MTLDLRDRRRRHQDRRRRRRHDGHDPRGAPGGVAGDRRRGDRGRHRRSGHRAARAARRSRPWGSARPATSTPPARSCCSRPTWPGATWTCKAELEERVDLPVVIENDANAAAWGEFRFGAGADVDDLLLVTVGTGVGGGIVLDGELYRGAFGVGAEIGHLRVVPGGRHCGCGSAGCLEQYASGTRRCVRETPGTAATARAAPDGPARALLERAGGDPAEITGPMITEPPRRATPSPSGSSPSSAGGSARASRRWPRCSTRR